MRTRSFVLCVGLLLPLGACRSADVATVHGLAGPAGPAIVTDAHSYTLETDRGALVTGIGFRFTNLSSRTLYVGNCNGTLAPVLEKRVGNGWRAYWSPPLTPCLSPPIRIRPGETIVDTIRVRGALPGSGHGPAFHSPDVEGTYRIVVTSVFFDHGSGRSGAAGPVPVRYRVSGPFDFSR
jgi:hypothetical protein